MTTYIKVENKLVTCPFDEAHKVKPSRLQTHIAKCRLNNLDKAKEVCPFNATHVLDQPEMAYHLNVCPDRGVLDRSVAMESLNKNNPFKGRTAVPRYEPAVSVDSEESWDIDISNVARPGYIPQGPPPGAILNPRDCAKPAERKQFYKDLRSKLNEIPEIPKVEPKILEPVEPRQPKMMSEASKLQYIAQKGSECRTAGIGRGRIAANIFPPNNATNIRSYSNVCNGMDQLSISRGRGFQQDNVPDIDEFPLLGFGRGTTRNPKKAMTPGDKSVK